MMNMATTNEEASKFITNIGVTEDGKQFVLTFGDGHVEYSECVTEHNYNFYLNRLEKQFLDYKEKFGKAMGEFYISVITKRFIATFSSIIGIFLTCSVDIHIVMKIIISLLIIFGALVSRISCNIKLMELDQTLDKVKIMDYLQKHMNKYYGKIVDEETGEIKETQVINFNNVDMFLSIESMDAMYEALTSDTEPVLKKV